MKKFFFSLFIAILFSVLNYYITVDKKITSNKAVALMEKVNGKVDHCICVRKTSELIRSSEYLPAQYHSIAYGGFSLFFGLWFSLAILFGIKPFFIDLKAFFPLKR